MAKIHQLSSQEIQKIAAGEVIDRPANIVKELIENSLDAGATHIQVYVEDGGKKLIRIVDNGCGMASDDARLCFLHHATSKISSLTDLETCTTFGFRGEALSSIAAVSHVTLITKEESAQSAVQLILREGAVIEESQTSANKGTDLSVSDLFYTIPARKKFLKTKETEWRHILQMVQAYCLDYPAIHFELFSEGESMINCPRTDSLEIRATQLWDYDMSHAMIPVSLENAQKNISVKGLISHHHFARYDRSSMFMFVNSRWIKNPSLSKAILKGYAHVLPPARYPAVALAITLDPQEVDINIHPRKEEVKFLHPHTIETLVQEGVKKALEAHMSRRLGAQKTQAPVDEAVACTSYEPVREKSYATSFISSIQRSFEVPSRDIFEPNIEPVKQTFSPSLSVSLPEEPAFEDEVVAQPVSAAVEPQEENLTIAPIEKEQEEPVNLIGQYKNTYILLEHEDGLMVIDQHAAHERILYERFAKRFQDIATIKLMFPIIITLTQSDRKLLESYMHVFNAYGIQMEPFGKQEFIVTATPVNLQRVNIADIVKEYLGELSSHDSMQADDLDKRLHYQLQALMACKAAVKAGDVLDAVQMKQLIQDLRKTDNNLTCPHGRPTTWLLDCHELEKKFKRDYKSNPKNFE
ncbi:MAG TPA: DNA mismatch repair endonuclease MutL [Candidatus Dependentiae bacterium]|nr:DNA mismatch repair endonuclease MutL [Candidatus Dependentiae bacterium]